MFEFNLLVLTSVTLLIIVVIVLFRSVLLKTKEVNRLSQILHGTIKKVVSTDHVCVFYFGYLRSVPKGKPIPSECMGCPDIFECLASKEERKGKKARKVSPSL
jgi:hypothetical protein